MATRTKAKSKPRAKKSKAPSKKSASKTKRFAAKRPANKTTRKPPANAANGGLPRPSAKPWGQAGRALDGVRILDFTHVQSGPTCTQLLAYMGADVIKVERPGIGDITRGQLRDVKGADSLYFTMLNGSKRSITVDSKHPKGKEILDRLVKQCDVLVENFAPGAQRKRSSAMAVFGLSRRRQRTERRGHVVRPDFDVPRYLLRARSQRRHAD